MNLKGKLIANSTLTATTTIPKVINTGGASTWNEISGKPFSTVDTTGGLTIYDNTLGIDTLDTIATIDYVDQQIAEIPQPDLSDYYTKTETDEAIADAVADIDLSDYALRSEIPTDVSELNNDSGYITDSALAGYATEAYVNAVTSTIQSAVQSDWAQSTTTSLDYIKNKPAIGTGTGIQSIWEGGYTFASGDLSHAEGGDGTTASGRVAHAENSGAVASGMGSHAEGWNTIAASDYQHAQGKGNIEDNSDIYADIIGNGYPDTSVTPTEIVRSNAEATDWNGNKYLAGDVYTHVTNWATTPTVGAYKLATEQYVDDAIADIPAPTVEIDNKSIIKNQDDELQTAVPLYSEEITEAHNTIRQWDNQYNNYGSTDSAYVTYCKNNTTSNSSTYYTVVVNYTFNGNDYTVSSKVNNIKGNSDNVDQSSDMWAAGFHTFRLVNYYISGVNHDCWMWCSNQTYTINWVMIKEVPYDETYSSSDINFTYTEYHQVPGEYLPIKVTPKQSSGQEVGTIEIDGNATTLYAPTVSTGYGLKETNGTIMLNSELNSFGPVDFGLTSQEQYLRLLTGTVANYTGGGIIKTASTDSANDIKMTTWPKLNYDSSSTRREKWYCTNFITDRNYRKVHTITPYYKWYDDRWFGPYYISGIFIGEYDANTTPTYNIRVEGWESILDSITWNASSNRYDFLLKEDITINPSQSSVPFSFIFYQGRDNIPDPQKINSYFLPLDNSTIVRDSDGKIKTAIPVPPTTDGTYTLQVTVSNGTITYSWI